LETMGSCCCCDAGDQDLPDDIRGTRCLCLPYKDVWAISAMILAIIATMLSWVWWVTFAVSIIGMVLFQILFCMRCRSGPIYGMVLVGVLSSLASLGIGIYVLTEWEFVTDCESFHLWTSTSYQHKDTNFEDDDLAALIFETFKTFDTCREGFWAGISFACSALWAVSAICLLYFVKSGRYTQCEKKYSENGDKNDNGKNDSRSIGSVDGTETRSAVIELATASPLTVDSAIERNEGESISKTIDKTTTEVADASELLPEDNKV